ncbi:hypothetical protein [Massilia genomosp. 1]|nr:hypothetical protein [Massilia genomosp. 1]
MKSMQSENTENTDGMSSGAMHGAGGSASVVLHSQCFVLKYRG